ncbi:hypothetical protein Droror1_Dr00012085 [Drosera rotundifolia]
MGIEDEDDLIVDGADYMLDARNPNFQQDVREFLASVPVVADQDYVCFLTKLGEFCDRVRDEEAETEKEEEEEVEPWYKLWLDGVTGYKRAYVFEGIDGEGRNVLVVYEYREEEEQEKEKKCCGRKRKRVRADSANGGDDSSSGKLLREDKSGKMDLNPSSKLKALYKHRSQATARDSSRGSGRLSREAKCVKNLNLSSELKTSCKRATTMKMNGCRGSGRTSREEKSGRNLKPSAELKALCQRRGEDSGKDETYCKMLENVLVDGEDMVLPLNEDGQVRYEDDVHGEISAGCSKEPPQADTLSKPPQADKRVEKDDLGQDDLEDDHLPFRERVLNLLRKPYDQEEHTRLRELAQLQKPIVYYRELRANDVKPYTVPGHMGKSYLDHHPDLQKLLRKVEPNNDKVLKVLRGFFFWLKHLTNDGAFRPWKDEACRALMLAS